MLIERGAPGFTIAAPSEFMSGEEWCELHFADCRIPVENVGTTDEVSSLGRLNLLFVRRREEHLSTAGGTRVSSYRN